MNTEPHPHVLDPTWSQEPIPWAEAADATMVARIHAACLDNCDECLTELAHETAASADTTAAVMNMAFSVYAMLPPSMRIMVERGLEHASAFLTVLRRIKDAGNEGLSSPVVLDMVRAFDQEDRWHATDAAIQLMGLYTQILQEKER